MLRMPEGHQEHAGLHNRDKSHTCENTLSEWTTCGRRHDKGPGQVGVQRHHGVVDAAIQRGRIRVHHRQLAAQVVPVARRIIVSLHPAHRPKRCRRHPLIFLLAEQTCDLCHWCDRTNMTSMTLAHNKTLTHSYC